MTVIHLLDRKATPQQIGEMLEIYPTLVKIVVDIRRRVLTESLINIRPRLGNRGIVIQSESLRRDGGSGFARF
jgi:hypothetical protein